MRGVLTLMVVALVGCPPVRSGGGEGGDDDDDAGTLEFAIVDPYAECGNGREPGLEVGPTNEAQIAVLHLAVSEGCCPEVLLDAGVDEEERTITMRYDLSRDDCECICILDVGYGLDGLSAGNWTLLVPGGLSATFVVRG